jgi:Lysozyme like domain
VRKLALILPLLVALVACTPAETRQWWEAYQRHPEGAVRFAKCVTARPKAWRHPGYVRHECRQLARAAQIEHNQANARWVPDTACSQWAQTALDAGFTKDEWYEPVARIMYAESRCDPSAYNGASGVTGLMQIMQFWADDCGGWPSKLYEPWFNLHCAVHVRNVQGWDAWVTW